MMKRLRFDLLMYRKLLGITMRGLMQYRADFWSSFVGVLLMNGANIAQIGILSWRFSTIGTWTAGELMFLFGIFMTCYSVYSILFYRIEEMEYEIVTGEFDRYLLRPMSPFLQLIGRELRYIGGCDMLMGVMLMVVGYGMVRPGWGMRQFLLLPVFILSGSVIITSVKLMLSSITFWVTRAGALHGILRELLTLVQKYPISIFHVGFRLLVTALVPIAFLNYYPAAYLLGKAEAPGMAALLAPLVALLFAVAASLLWRTGLRRYASTGS